MDAGTIYTLVAQGDYSPNPSADTEVAMATLLRTIMHISVDGTVVTEDDVALTRDTLVVSMALVVLDTSETVDSPNAAHALGTEDYLWTTQRCIRLATNAAGNLRANALPERPYHISETFDVKVKRKLDDAFVGLLIDVATLGDPDPTTVYQCDIIGTSRCLLGGNF